MFGGATRTLTALLAALCIAVAAGAQPAPTPTPAPEAVTRPLSLNLARIAAGDDRTGHAEFNLSLRREFWNDPMVRLDFALNREQAAARRGGMFGFGTQFTAGTLPLRLPGVDSRLILKGPWAEDWHDLTTGEKIGRATETVVTYGILFELLRALHK
jgi:hypothetical protein